MNMVDLELNVKDTNATIIVNLVDLTGVIVDLTDASEVYFEVVYNKAVRDELLMTVISATDGRVSIQMNEDSLASGINTGRIRIDWTDTTVSYSTTQFSIKGLT
jgi:hypothetical protein